MKLSIKTLNKDLKNDLKLLNNENRTELKQIMQAKAIAYKSLNLITSKQFLKTLRRINEL